MRNALPKILVIIILTLSVACKQAGRTDAQIDSVRHAQVTRFLDTAFNYRLSDPRQTLTYSERALDIAIAAKDRKGQAEAYRVRGVAHRQLSNIYQATEDLTAAIELFTQVKDTLSTARTYVNLSNVYTNINQHKARKLLQYALSLVDKNPRAEEIKAGIFFNLATLYEVQTNYRQSLKYLDNSYKIFKKLKDEKAIVQYYQNSGMIYFYLKNFEEAKRRSGRALQEAKIKGYHSSALRSSLLLATIYLQKKELEKAEEIINFGRQLAVKTKNRKIETLLIHRAYLLALARGNYPEALDNLQTVFKYDSTLLDKDQSTNIGITASNYLQQQALQQKNLTIAEQKYEQAKSVQFIIAAICCLLTVIGAAIGYHYYRQKKWKKEQTQVANEIAVLEQKAILAMMNPHFVFNIMSSIQQYIQVADNHSAGLLLSRFAKLIRKHLEICINSTISLDEELLYLDLYMSLEKSRFGEKMNYELKIEPDVDTEDILIPSMLIQPFVENAIQHGVMSKEQGGLVIVSFQQDNDYLMITIFDNGPGLLNSAKNTSPGHISRGIGLIRDRVSLLNKINQREITINQQQNIEAGTKIEIRLPI